ncbi:MAG TPA: dephospho-CoA kinase [Caproiciproducens sp.]|nr:dephospho-CoA kinase [Caproiciproducens sp.]
MTKSVIGLTGPTGAGKSTVAKAFQEAGCGIVDADRIARVAVTRTDCLSALKEEFGADLQRPDGTLDRKLLAQRAFAEPRKTARLNAITHPVIMDEIKREIARERLRPVKAVILDAPLLFESGADGLCGATVAVIAPQELRLARVLQRDAITKEQALARFAAQHDDLYYRSRAGYLLDGSMSLESIPAAVQNLLEKILGELHETI